VGERAAAAAGSGRLSASSAAQLRLQQGRAEEVPKRWRSAPGMCNEVLARSRDPKRRRPPLVSWRRKKNEERRPSPGSKRCPSRSVHRGGDTPDACCFIAGGGNRTTPSGCVGEQCIRLKERRCGNVKLMFTTVRLVLKGYSRGLQTMLER